MDPLTKDYPWYTPYQFAGNKPIWAIDLDGLEELIKTFRYEDGKVTQLAVINNGYLRRERMSHGLSSVNKVVYDKRTGKRMNPAEIGQVQHQYFDAQGNRLNIRRDYEGNYVPGDNEMMPIGANNLLGSIYIGPNNPTYKDATGEDQYDYRREPQDEVDAAALRHDKDYDLADAAGAGDAFFNRDIAPADRALVNSSKKIVQKARQGGNDAITGKPVSAETARRARIVAGFFGWILSSPDLKGEDTGTHNIK